MFTHHAFFHDTEIVPWENLAEKTTHLKNNVYTFPV